MQIFKCDACGHPLFFENFLCESCGRRLGFLPSQMTMAALEPIGDRWRSLVEPAAEYVYCTNLVFDSCNWLVRADSGECFCVACRHNRTIPDLSNNRNIMLWRRIETAKRRLFYSLLRLKLPLLTKVEDATGLAFDFLASADKPIVTGHLDGVITINLAEADDAEREKQRGAMDEPYRTLLGHFRHEIAHYYWDRLVRDHGSINEFRNVFGDERADYGDALKRHHLEGPPQDWSVSFVSAYASSHPWEDFAETWAHYFHIVDTLETARAFGVRIRPRATSTEVLDATVDFDPYVGNIDRLIDAWLPLTFAFNSINRSMGLGDLYPFILGAPTMFKLAYIHDKIHGVSPSEQQSENVALKAVVASLKRRITSPSLPIQRSSNSSA
jgi:hypothetical protein